MPLHPKISRTARVRNEQTLGQLARLLSVISDAGGGVGDIHLLTVICTERMSNGR